MKKRNLNSKKMRLLSVGLLASTAVLSVENTQPILAQESNDLATKEAEGKETVTILSSSHEATSTTTEEPSSSASTTSTTESILTETSSTEDSSQKLEESDTTESTTDESTTDTTSSQDSSSTTSETSTSTTTSSSSTSSSSTSSSSSSSSTSSSSGTSTSSSAKPKPTQPKPTRPSSNGQATTNRPSTSTGTPSNVSSGSSSSTPIGEQVFHVSPNLTTKTFIGAIGEDARKIAGQNNLYASVMIAQAILESASGNSALASAPNYNLFGIKGSYKGQSANFLTSEDDGSGSMYAIRSNFRKYPSYKESLEDYVKLIRGGTDSSNGFYSGTWKTNAKTYKEATNYLTGRYATDTSYAAKLNSLIEAYNLNDYDEIKDEKASDSKVLTGVDKVEKRDTVKDQKLEFITHVVKKGESLKSIGELYNISTMAILEKNQLDRRMLYVGQKLIIPKEQTAAATTVVQKEDVVDRSLSVVKKVSSALTGKEVNVAKKSVSEYKVSASRKKTDATYKVKKNDTLASISKETGISVWSLKEWNQLDKYFLTEGQLLVLAPSFNV